MLGAVMFGHQQFQPVLQAIIELAEKAAKDPWDLPPPSPEGEEIERKVRDAVSGDLATAYRERQKQVRSDRIDAAKAKLQTLFPDDAPRQIAAKAFKEIEKDIVRGAILKGEPRIDGRDTKTIRPIVCEVGAVHPR
jgi:polyribonucleotide nucleotidyltransferase